MKVLFRDQVKDLTLNLGSCFILNEVDTRQRTILEPKSQLISGHEGEIWFQCPQCIMYNITELIVNDVGMEQVAT